MTNFQQETYLALGIIAQLQAHVCACPWRELEGTCEYTVQPSFPDEETGQNATVNHSQS